MTEMKTLTIDDVTYEIVDDKARKDLDIILPEINNTLTSFGFSSSNEYNKFTEQYPDAIKPGHIVWLPNTNSDGTVTKTMYQVQGDKSLNQVVAIKETPLSTVVYVTVVGSNGSYTSDKTFADVRNAYNAGRPVCCKLSFTENQITMVNMHCALSYADSNYMVFSVVSDDINIGVYFPQSGPISVMYTAMQVMSRYPL